MHSVQRSANRAAGDILTYSNIVKAQIPVLKDQTARAISFLHKMVALSADFGTAGIEGIKNLLPVVLQHQEQLAGAIESTRGFMTVISQTPRVTGLLAKSRSASTETLRDLIEVLQSTYVLMGEVEKLLRDMLGRAES